MRKFVVEVILAASAILVTALFLVAVDTPSTIAKKINAVARPLEIINLGTSHGNNFDYSVCNCYGEGFNKEGNTLYYDLQNYLFLSSNGILTESAIILIPVSYFSFGLDENRLDRLPDNSFVNDYYYYLPEEQIYAYSSRKKKNLSVFTIQENVKQLFGIEEHKDNIPLSMTDEQLTDHAVSRALRHKKLGQFSGEKKNYDYLQSLIRAIKNNGHRPVLVTTPYHNSYNDNFGRAWLEKHYFQVMKVFSLENDIPYLDYSHDDRFRYETQYFYNSDHLNDLGRKFFSRILFKDLENLEGW